MIGDPLFLTPETARVRARALIQEGEQLLREGQLHGRLAEVVAELRRLAAVVGTDALYGGTLWGDRCDCVIQAWREGQ